MAYPDPPAPRFPNPLGRGCSRRVFESNVRLLHEEGRPVKQALAIAYSTRRRAGCPEAMTGRGLPRERRSNPLSREEGDEVLMRFEEATFQSLDRGEDVAVISRGAWYVVRVTSGPGGSPGAGYVAVSPDFLCFPASDQEEALRMAAWFAAGAYRPGWEGPEAGASTVMGPRGVWIVSVRAG